jgi:hypothetical protein
MFRAVISSFIIGFFILQFRQGCWVYNDFPRMELLSHSVGVKQCELGPIKLCHFQFVVLDSVDVQHRAVYNDVALQPFDFDFDFVY